MSDTPRTDAATVKATAKCLDYSCTDFKPMVPVEVSKQLETENNKLVAALQKMVDVGCEFYDMECGENGGPAIEEALQTLAQCKQKEGGK